MTTDTALDVDAERQAIVERVRGVERTCFECGARRPCKDVKITEDHLRGTGELVWGICPDCGPAAKHRNLAAVVAVDLLGLSPDDPVLRHVHVDSFGDLDTRTPDRPGSKPWGHVDTDDLAKQVTRWRKDTELRTGGPCSWCGMGTTPPGTSWRQAGKHDQCGACATRFATVMALPADGRASENRTVASARDRDTASAVICGFEHRGQIHRWKGMGAQLGLIWFHESGRKKANTSPFGHLDVNGMRAEAKRLSDERNSTVPSAPVWWNPDKIGTVSW